MCSDFSLNNWSLEGLDAFRFFFKQVAPVVLLVSSKPSDIGM